jgi:alpha-L-glutamate ligase-like protein
MFRVLKKAGILTPLVIHKFKEPSDIFDFEWDKLPSAFVIKPSRGFGGEGIIVVKRKARDGNGWITTQRERVTVEDLKLQVLDILEGAYSIGNVFDVAFIQEYVPRHKAFRRYAYRGTPDVRVIVFNKIPVMAMLRLPTKESQGRANLHQGAIAAGIDIATGITTRAIWHGDPIKYKPGTKRKLNGIKIPHWDQILGLSVRCAEVVPLGYMGVDIVLHPEKGPMVLELNARPGLQIQLANMVGLKKRLERVEDLEVRNPEHGVRIAKAIFGERFSEKVKLRERTGIIKAVEEIKIQDAKGKMVKVLAKIDTGAWSSSIDRDFARELGLLTKSRILWYRKKRSSFGEEERPVIAMTFWLSGRKISTVVSTARRYGLAYKMIIGRTDLRGFLVDPEISDDSLKRAKKW